jgi:hypothetical protein
MVNLDRRALVVGHWGPDGTTPNNSRVRGVTQRLEKVLGQEGQYPFLSMSGATNGPDVLHNPSVAQLTAKISDEPGHINDNSVLLIHYIGHAVGSGDNDLRLRLRYKSNGGAPQYMNLSTLLNIVRDGNFRNLVLILDCCHAGRTLQLYENFPQGSFVMLATGTGYAFNCDFSDSIISTMERAPSKRDQRIDRQRQGFTYERLFEVARSPFVSKSLSEELLPKSFEGGLQHELIAAAPVIITEEYNTLIPRRTVYGRVFTCLELLSEATCLKSEFPNFIKRRREFLVEGEEGEGRYVGFDRARQYCDFLLESGLVDEGASRLWLSELGQEALDGRFNAIVLDAILNSIMPAEVTYEVLDETIHSLIQDMIPPTPPMIAERLRIRGIALALKPSVRVALMLLPSTGRFLKSSSDALFPSEPELVG